MPITDDQHGIVFDIQRFSVHDGPGIRTSVFLKGCSLRCFWCHNPESIRPKPEIQFVAENCIACGECLLICPDAARSVNDAGEIVYSRQQCQVCGTCVETCFAGATLLVGQEMAVTEVMNEIMADRQFYDTSDGGVTLSGGEPVLQKAFTLAVLSRCQAEGIHTAIETAGNYHWSDLEALLPHIDLVMMDLKQLDPQAHRAATGVSNERILENARHLADTHLPVWFRTPVIPTVNDTPEAISAIATFVHELVDRRAETTNGSGPAPIELELLMFHQLASDKYRSLGLDYRAGQLNPITKDRMIELANVARSCDVTLRGNY